ncbi:MAG: hypothetical protein CM1200mP26_19410 [Acidimicrobiales bacterium]|nr:MAG: hypothetical protein CM1200mP26_19410 [Acidimicrobiales bacterium]
MDFDLSSDQVALRDAASGFLDDRCTSSHVRLAADRGGFDLSLWTSMVDQGWISIATSESAGGLGMGSVEAAVLLEQLGRYLAPVPLNQHLNALHVLADTPWSEGLLEGSLIATVARRSVERNADGSVTGCPEPVIYGASADLLVVPAGDELVVVDLTAIDRKPEPAMDRTRELAWIGMEEVPAVTVGDASAVAAHLDRGAVFHSVELLGAGEAYGHCGGLSRVSENSSGSRSAPSRQSSIAVPTCLSTSKGCVPPPTTQRGRSVLAIRTLRSLRRWPRFGVAMPAFGSPSRPSRSTGALVLPGSRTSTCT